MLSTLHHFSSKQAQEEIELRQLSQRKGLGHFQDHARAEEPPYNLDIYQNNTQKTEKEQSYGCKIMSVVTTGF